MRKFVAMASVSVALCSAAAPAVADAPVAHKAVDGSNSSYTQLVSRSSDHQNYWTASSDYFVSKPGATPASAETPRHVLITGWHPVEGFEAEIAQETRNRAAHQ